MFARNETIYGYTFRNENYKEGDIGIIFYVLKERRDFALAQALRGGFTEVNSFQFTVKDLRNLETWQNELKKS